LKVKNSIEKSVLKGNPLLKTTKSDTQNHGLGLDNVKNIVEAHNGFVNIQEKTICLKSEFIY
jgi:sensor histidine kinase regulating citrate/malate metabolism